MPGICTVKFKCTSGHQMLFELLEVLEELDTKERESQQDRKQQESDDPASLPLLCKVHGHRHRQTAREQNRRVDSSQENVEPPAALGERNGIRPAICGIPEKQAAEEHDLRGQE